HKLEELVLQIFENLLFRLKENYSMWSNLNFILRL
ncbi:MAG: hypothetical protein ACI9XO_004946, partial [Paraglaciecola sp.]